MRIRLVRRNPADHFTMLPNDFLRTGGPTCLTLRARALLAALVSFSDGWEITRALLAELAPELGSDALDTVLSELREKNHLRTVRGNGGAGKFEWTWYVSLEPWEEDPQPGPGGPSRVDPSPDEPSMVSPGKTLFPQVKPSVDDPGMAALYREDQEDLKRPARQLVPQPPGGDHASAAQAGGTDQSRQILRSASAGLGARTPSGPIAGRLITEVAAALGRGWTPTAVETALKSPLNGVTDVGRVWLTRLGRDLAGTPTAVPFGFAAPGEPGAGVDPELARVRADSLARRDAQLARQLERRAAAARFGHGITTPELSKGNQP
jgi:hypothetical protein